MQHVVKSALLLDTKDRSKDRSKIDKIDRNRYCGLWYEAEAGVGMSGLPLVARWLKEFPSHFL